VVLVVVVLVVVLALVSVLARDGRADRAFDGAKGPRKGGARVRPIVHSYRVHQCTQT